MAVINFYLLSGSIIIAIMLCCCCDSNPNQKGSLLSSDQPLISKENEKLIQVSIQARPLIRSLSNYYSQNKSFPKALGDDIKLSSLQFGIRSFEIIDSPLNTTVTIINIDNCRWEYNYLSKDQYILQTLPGPEPSRDYCLFYRSYGAPGWYLSLSESGNDIRPLPEVDNAFDQNHK